jgi:hypothetical protein
VPFGPLRLIVHPRPSCVRSSRWSLTVMLPVRAAAASLDDAVTVMVAAPCPEVDESFSHEASLWADQVQSRAALSVTDTAPPWAGTLLDDVVIEAAHRTAPGAVTFVTDVDPQAVMTMAAKASVMS